MEGFFKSTSWNSKKKKEKDILEQKLPMCGNCGLLNGCFSPRMKVAGSGNQKVLFVGGAPGESDDRLGEHFSGTRGDVLRDALKRIGERLEDCWVTYSIICRPKEGIKTNQIQSCRPNLNTTIKELQPNVIIPIGVHAIKSVIEPEWGSSINDDTKWRGWKIPSPGYNAWICPIRGLQYIIEKKEDALLLKELDDDLQQAFELSTNKPDIPSLQDYEDKIEIVTDQKLVKKRLRDLLDQKGQLAFDYETTGLKPDREEHRIVSCAFSFEGEDNWGFMVNNANVRLLSKVLKSKNLEKIAANLKFEERWTQTKLGHPVANWTWDTMIASHILDNRKGITGLKFQAYVNMGIVGYDDDVKRYLSSEDSNGINNIDEVDDETLLRYNIFDALLEYELSQQQMSMF